MSALQHFADVSESLRVLTSFIEWLDENGFEIEPCPYCNIPLLNDRKPTRLIDKFLEIDRKALDSERKELLDQCRNVGMVNPDTRLTQPPGTIQ